MRKRETVPASPHSGYHEPFSDDTPHASLPFPFGSPSTRLPDSVQVTPLPRAERPAGAWNLGEGTSQTSERERRELAGIEDGAARTVGEMVPGFVSLGAVAVLFQLFVVASLYWFVRWRRPVATPATRRRAVRAVGGGVALAALGQLGALGAVGSVRVTAVLSLGQAVTVANAGLLVALLGYVVVCGGFLVHARAG